MQLGEWIEFDTIVIKEQTASGSQPVTTALNRKRRGMVIGSRLVYDVEAGAPPTLSNGQTVLLVAVSLHRCYRVFPTDARPATAPTPRRQRGAQPATGATINLAAGGNGGTAGAALSQSDLELLVADEITRCLAASEIFTAYDITLGLRNANPGIPIPHDSVRHIVHAQMDTVVNSKLYEREEATFGSNTALRYLPA